MLKDLSREQIIESMKKAPGEWADLILLQEEMIGEMDSHLNDCYARLEYLLRDPDEQDH